MSERSFPRRSNFPIDLRRAAGWLLALCLSAPVLAGEAYLAPGHPDGMALLAPPPAAGSVEEAADLQEARAVFDGRTAEEEARAIKDDGLSFELFKPAIGPAF